MRTGFTRLIRLIAALGMVAGLSAVPIAQVTACSCIPMAPAEAAAVADAAFSGTVVHQEPMDMPAMPLGGGDEVLAAGPIAARVPDQMGGTLYVFEVDGVAKGDLGTQVNVAAGGDGAGCGISFGMNERWLVFATAEGDMLTTHLCAGNVPLAPGEEPPITVSAPTASGTGDSGTGLPLGVLGPVAVVLGLVGVSGYLFWRADRPS